MVAPAANPNTIRLHFAGAANLALTAAGDLSVVTKGGQIAFHKPVIYQESNGRRTPVEGGFALGNSNSVHFRLGSYNHQQPLVIDPVLAYSTYLSGTYPNTAIALDGSGNAYIAGAAETGFPVTPGAFQTVDKAEYGYNAFITKLNSTGTALIYSTYIGGSGANSYGGDFASSIVVDSSGNAYITGTTRSKDFPVTKGAFQTTNKNTDHGNAFVTKLDPSGTALIYSTYLGGSGNNYSGSDFSNAIAVDGSGNAYVAGGAYSSDFPVTKGLAFQTYKKTAESGSNAFVSELDAVGSKLLYSTYLGGHGGGGLSNGYNAGDYAQALALDDAGNVYVAGLTNSKDFPLSEGAYQTTNKTYGNLANYGTAGTAFLTSLNTKSPNLRYSTYLGGSVFDQSHAIAVDGSGNAYVAGWTRSTDFPVTPGAFQTSNKQGIFGSSAFVAKLDLTGSTLVYSTYLGGTNSYTGDSGDQAKAIAVDGEGNAYVGGLAASTDFPMTVGAFEEYLSKGGSHGGFVSAFNASGSLRYSTFLGSHDYNEVDGLALTAKGSVYLTGATTSLLFPTTAGAFQTQIVPNPYSGFVAKLNTVPAANPTFSPASGKYIGSVSITLNETTPGAIIRYTLDGSSPVAASPQYSGPIKLSSGYTVINTVADSSDYAPGPVTQASYTVLAQTPTPVISPASGSYPAGTVITLSDANPKATLRYTTDGSIPINKSNYYGGPITLAQSETIRAIAISTDDSNSATASAAYAVQ